jgi:hypothetical protein
MFLKQSSPQIVGRYKEDIMSYFPRKLIKYVHANEAVIANEYRYGDGPPLMPPSFSAAKKADRKADVVDLLEQASQKSNAKGDRKQAWLFRKLANKIDRCRHRDRCGSPARGCAKSRHPRVE